MTDLDIINFMFDAAKQRQKDKERHHKIMVDTLIRLADGKPIIINNVDELMKQHQILSQNYPHHTSPTPEI